MEISDLLKQIIFVKPFNSVLYFVFTFSQEKGFIAFPSSMTTVKADMKHIFRSKNTKQLYHNVLLASLHFFLRIFIPALWVCLSWQIDEEYAVVKNGLAAVSVTGLF